MKRVLLIVSSLGAFFMVASAQGHEGHEHKKAETSKVQTLRGEVVDTGCYLAHEATGADHKSCAVKCISGGMPMGLLTSNGVLYLLTMNHDNADPYNKAKDMAALTVDVTGPVLERAGMKAIEVTSISEVKAPAK